MAAFAAGCCLGLCGGASCALAGATGTSCRCDTVNPDQVAAKESCGYFRGLVGPGLHCLEPGAQLRKVTTRVKENQVVCETKTSDNVFVTVHIAVQQTVDLKMAKEAIYKLADPYVQIESYVSDCVRSHVPQTTLDNLFVAKEEIAQDVMKRLSKAMESHGYKILSVQVTDIQPDKTVRDAMNQINTNKRLRQAAEEKAEADKMVIIKAAEAEMMSKKLQGEGIARSRKAIVEGLQQAVGAQHSPTEVSELLLTTQYLETLDKMARGECTTIFVPAGSSTTEAAAAIATKKFG
mmetsp:Transcript_29187/g.51032  ORF Transcript_29187/g.51032 Transcript_29187/m.51032 type:complete len:293 (-) Transcript_29187:41-919(-)